MDSQPPEAKAALECRTPKPSATRRAWSAPLFCPLFWAVVLRLSVAGGAAAQETNQSLAKPSPTSSVVADKNVRAAVGTAGAFNSVYLFTSFRGNGEDGLRFLYSFDGYHWTNVPGTFLTAKVGPSKIMRDPSLLRGPDGTFHLVWTTGWHTDKGFGYAHTKDLVHWSDPRFIEIMGHEPDTVNVWAPELFYHDAGKQFIITWASTIPGRYPDNLEPHTNNHRLYYTSTRDFVTFSSAKLFFEPGYSVIDPFILKDGSRYVLLHKDNTRPMRNLRAAFGPSPLGRWSDISAPFTQKFTEGPCALKIGEDWLIYFDAYQEKIYGAVRTHDFKTFTNITSEVSFPEGHKHGTALPVERKVLDYLLRVGQEQGAGAEVPLVTRLSSSEIAARLAKIDSVANRGPFKPDWESLKNFRAPKWYEDAKLGLFLHWGVYSVPAFGSEWYPRNMYRTNSAEFRHHLAVYGPPSKFGYKDFIPEFKTEKFDPKAWAKLFKEAGAKYVVPVAEHHDGFAMYASDCTDWCAARMGPGRDIIGELAQAVRKAGLAFGVSSHRAEHWFFFDQGTLFDSDVRDTNYAGLYGPARNQRLAENQSAPPDRGFLEDWLLRCTEIVDKYRPQLVYFDWWICQPVFQPYLKRFAAYYYNRGVEWRQDVAINFKEWEGQSFPPGTGVFDIERGQSGDIRPDFWQTDTSVSKNSWGYVTNQNYKQAGAIICDLVDIVSKNGTLLLNIGPKPDGTIAEPEQKMLLDIGRWLKANGEAIYGTRPWKIYGEGPTKVVAGSFADVKRKPFTSEDFRFTTKADALYAIALAWPENGQLVVKSLGTDSGLGPGRVHRVQLLGYRGALEWRQTSEGLVVKLPDLKPCEYAVALKIAGNFKPRR